MSRYNLTNRHILITGASSGIGRELSRCFAEEGAHCILAAHPSEDEILREWAVELCNRYSVNTWHIPVDLADKSGPENLYNEVKSIVHCIDVLVNNAGVAAYGDFHSMPHETLDMILAVNARAYMILTRYFAQDMVIKGDGRILNVSSVAAFQPTSHHAIYGATKAFVQSFSEAVRMELKGTGITVCTLNPSYTDTPLLKGENFPEKLWWYYISGLSSPARIAEKGVRAFKKGKPVYLPGLRNWMIHRALPRLMPGRLIAYLSYLMLKGRNR